MKKLNLGACLAFVMAVTGCAMTKGPSSQERQEKVKTQAMNTSKKNQVIQTEGKDQQALSKAQSLTQGWPEASIKAAGDMVAKYGEPDESTSEMLIWKSNIAPFKEIRVHKTVYTHKFPLLHQNALEHVVEYKVPTDKVDNVLQYNEAIIIDKNKGLVSSFADSEPMNILALNLANDVIEGKLSAEAARVKFGKETLNFMNGNKTALTSVISFGGQYQTPDVGETVTDKIRWVGDPDRRAPATRQAEEAKQAEEERIEK